jgi:hypothetical protein
MGEGRVSAEKATDAIFAGQFDHWGDVTVRSGPIVECSVDDCDYLERIAQVCVLPGKWGAPSGEREMELAGTFAFQLHLSKCHLDDVINAMEDGT